MKLTGKKVLLTGAGGFVGSHLVEVLAQKGAKVEAFVHYNSRNDWGMLEWVDKKVLDQVEVVSGDIRDSDCVRKITKDQDIVFHLAALIGIPYSYVNPLDVADTNIQGTLNLLLAAKELGIEKFIHTSTSEVYGTAQKIPMDENHPVNPQSPYAATKASADQLALSFYYTYQLPVGIIRPFNIYGSRQSARSVIPSIIMQVLTKDEIKIGSLTTTRDLTYVTDSVKGFIQFAECDKIAGEVVNLGSENEISVKNIIEIVEKNVNKKVKIVQEDKRKRPEKSEVQKLVSNSDKAKKLFGWKPETGIDQGIQKTITWIKDNFDFFKKEIYNI
ncbi:MAG: GDP-mannose 4,6-dehydratase [Candidatus Zixiibacteriota bacterium]